MKIVSTGSMNPTKEPKKKKRKEKRTISELLCSETRMKRNEDNNNVFY